MKRFLYLKLGWQTGLLYWTLGLLSVSEVTAQVQWLWTQTSVGVGDTVAVHLKALHYTQVVAIEAGIQVPESFEFIELQNMEAVPSLDASDFNTTRKPIVLAYMVDSGIGQTLPDTVHFCTFLFRATEEGTYDLKFTENPVTGQIPLILGDAGNLTYEELSMGRVEVKACPKANITTHGDLEICAGDSLKLQANERRGLTYQWLKDGKPLAGQTNAVLWVAESGDYQVIEMDSSCTKSSEKVTVSVHELPKTDILLKADETIFCESGTALITLSKPEKNICYQLFLDGKAHGKSQVSNGNPLTFSLTTDKSASVKIFAENPLTECGHFLQNELKLSVYQPIEAEIEPLVEGCDSVKLSIDVPKGAKIQWVIDGNRSAKDTLQVLILHQSAKEVYAEITYFTCPSESNRSEVKVNASPALPKPIVDSVFICQGEDVPILGVQSPTGSTTVISWYASKTASKPLTDGENTLYYVPSRTGTFLVEAHDVLTGCKSAKVPIYFTEEAQPKAEIVNANTGICEGGFTVLRANPVKGASYQWYHNFEPLLGKTDSILTVRQLGIYHVKVLTPIGCSSEYSQPIEVKTFPKPYAELLAEKSVFCEGDNVTLTVKVLNASRWVLIRNGEIFQNSTTNPRFDINQTGHFKVVAYNDGCASDSSNTITLESMARPKYARVSIPKIICAGNKTSISPIFENAVRYEWKSATGTVISNTQNLSNVGGGTYSVTAYNSEGCGLTKVFQVYEPQKLELTNLETTSNYCGEKSGTISGEIEGGLPPFTVRLGIDNIHHVETITVLERLFTFRNLEHHGLYELQITDKLGCRIRANEVNVKREDARYFQIRTITTPTTCFAGLDGTIKVETGLDSAAYLWKDGARSQNRDSLQAGIYELKVVDLRTNCHRTVKIEVGEPENPATRIALITADAHPYFEPTLADSEAKSWQWFFNGRPINTEEGRQRILFPQRYGDYYVMAELNTSKKCNTVLSNTLSFTIILQQEATRKPSKITVFPNPTTDWLNIRLESVKNPEEIQIWNTTGQVLFRQLGSESTPTSIDVSKLPNGLYIIRIQTNNGILTQKFIKR